MSVKNDEKHEPIVCGAVYRKEMPDNSTEYATMVAVVERGGQVLGLLQRLGYSPERVKQGSNEFTGWKLYAEPSVIKAPKPRAVSRTTKREQALA